VTVGRRLGWGGLTLEQVRALGGRPQPVLARPEPGETAAILFTSGSTGVAKGVVYTHEIFDAQVELLRTVYGVEPGEVDLPTFPLFGLFGPALGMTVIVPEMDPTRPAEVDPRKIVGAIRAFQVTNLFGSPALVRRVGAHGVTVGARLPSLRRVLCAGAPVPARAVEQFQSLLTNGAQLHTPYGATEALPVTTIAADEVLRETRRGSERGAGICVGRPVPGVEVSIIAISDGATASWHDGLAVPQGEIGEIVVRGPVVARWYYGREESTKLAKIEGAGGGFWHRMGDVGYLDERGRIWFCGRKSQRVVTPRGTLFTIPCEGVFNAHPAVRRSALVGVERKGQAVPVLCVEREPGTAGMTDETLRVELLALGAANPLTREIETILFHPAFPVDVRHNAKIFREQLAAWADKVLR
jgi:acyl-coenzyme A synthetase/AMP-(fatty) acid ligase